MSPFTYAFESPYRVILKITGPLTKDKIEPLRAALMAAGSAIKEASEKAGGRIDILLDMLEFDGTYDVEAMSAFAEFADGNRDFVRKTAGFVSAEKAAIAGEMVAALASRENIKFFPTKEEAETWLA